MLKHKKGVNENCLSNHLHLFYEELLLFTDCIYYLLIQLFRFDF